MHELEKTTDAAEPWVNSQKPDCKVRIKQAGTHAVW